MIRNTKVVGNAVILEGIEDWEVDYVGKRLKEADRIEAGCVSNMSPMAMLRYTAGLDGYRRAVYLDAAPAVLLGAIAGSSLSDSGIAWMMTTDAISTNKLSFVRAVKHCFREMQELHPLLYNWVYAENDSAIKLLRWLGFAVNTKPEKMGLHEAHDFLKFHWRRENV